ncbi:UDP-glycosyltransferase 76B1-like [Malania oleifera]|uniref:UDP-glycosyltransferase 76B1-like n=1 Tax=Malania oleifera TaxID=397392 RepID=UPI0025AE224E|nr:UDP-glycosyltransferase 76B1-like [Malania oleifera]
MDKNPVRDDVLNQEEKDGSGGGRRRQRVVLFPLPLHGHQNPMLQLAKILDGRGFSVVVVQTQFNYIDPSNYPQYSSFTIHSISNGFSQSEASSMDVVTILSLLNLNCVEPFRDCLARLMESKEDAEPVACLISDAVLHFTQAVADSLNLPRITLRTSGASSFLGFAAVLVLRDKGYFPLKDSELEEPVPGLPHLRLKDLPLINAPNLDSYHNLLDGMIGKTRASAGLIWNSFEELEHDALSILRHDYGIPTFPIGPFHKLCPLPSASSSLTADPSATAWLDHHPAKSVVYVSFGSLAALDESQFLELAHGVARSNQPFLWVVRPGLVRGSHCLEALPKGFAEAVGGRGHFVKWAHQQEVLAHEAVGAFCTHAGWNSTLESIGEGVPMICVPCFADQRVNARYVSYVWRVGVQVEWGIERGGIERAIRKVMVEKEGEEIRDRIGDLKVKANLCASQGGSAHKALENLISHISAFT